MLYENFIAGLEKNIAARPVRMLETPEYAVPAAVMVIFKRGRRGVELCFIKRSQNPQDRFSGHMAFPGGMKEENDADLLATAIRETREEIGVDLESKAKIAGRLDDEIPALSAGSKGKAYMVTPFVCALFSDPEARVRDEVEQIFWMPVCDLKRGGGKEKPEFFCGGQKIWGMTARIVEKLLKILPCEKSVARSVRKR